MGAEPPVKSAPLVEAVKVLTSLGKALPVTCPMVEPWEPVWRSPDKSGLASNPRQLEVLPPSWVTGDLGTVERRTK